MIKGETADSLRRIRLKQEHVDAMSPWFPLALAATLQLWVLICAGAATVVEAKVSSWQLPGAMG
jgi:hypothetical protein